MQVAALDTLFKPTPLVTFNLYIPIAFWTTLKSPHLFENHSPLPDIYPESAMLYVSSLIIATKVTFVNPFVNDFYVCMCK